MSISTTEWFFFGADPLTHIVAAELSGGDQIRVFRRRNGDVVAEDVPFDPWLVAERGPPWCACPGVTGIEPLAGEHPLRHLVTFKSWGAFPEASRAARDSAERIYRLRSPIEQYFAING